jgi:hypothetical protein
MDDLELYRAALLARQEQTAIMVKLPAKRRATP